MLLLSFLSVLTSGEKIVSPSSVDAASLAKHWVTLSRSSSTSPNAPKHRGIIVLPWDCDSNAFLNGPITLLLPSPTTADAHVTSKFLTLRLLYY